MSRLPAPLWLTANSRFAGWPAARARIALVLIALLMLASLTALGSTPPSADKTADEIGDVMLYESIVDGMRHGGDYYLVTASALRAGNYPLRPFVTFRLPTLASVQALLPEAAVTAWLYVLATGTFYAWFRRLQPAFSRPAPLIAALMLLAGGMVVFVLAGLAAMHEIWGGLLIALSLALRRPGRVVEAIAVATMAMLIRETAALYVLVMAGLAMLEGNRREAIGWVASLGVLAVAVVAHAYAVGQVVRISDLASPGWGGLLGFGFFVQAMHLSTALAIGPLWLAALLTGLALIGWASWRDPLALRTLATLSAYALLISLFGRADTFYWGLMAAPTLLVGLVFAPDGLRDLVHAARAHSRVTVTRVSQ